MAKKLEITLVRSVIGRPQDQKRYGKSARFAQASSNG